MRNVPHAGAAGPAVILAATLLLTGCEQAAQMAPRDAGRRAPARQSGDKGGDRLIEAKPQSPETAQMEKEAFQQINQLRKEKGLAPLKSDEKLTQLARGFSRLMAEEKFFDHESPSGETVVDRARKAGLEYWRLGENIFKSVNVPNPADRAVDAWMKSPGHRKNILTEEFTTTGLGVWKQGKTVYFTQEFTRPR
ncbi:MAG: CAP domain-containing protein [Actinomycetota bacterium]